MVTVGLANITEKTPDREPIMIEVDSRTLWYLECPTGQSGRHRESNTISGKSGTVKAPDPVCTYT